MKIFARRPSWYADGLAFECVRCGRCCAGPGEGYVWVRAEDIDAIAEHLKLPVEQVRQRCVRCVGQRYSLVEEPRSKDCCFLRYDADGLSKCLVYPVRPIQCRTWPFWPGNLVGSENWCLAGRRCPGINRGETHTSDEIQRKRQQTNP